MSLVAICEAPGTSASTTTVLALAAFAPAGRPAMVLECDPSGGDLAGWAGLHGDPSWSSAVAAPDRSWPGVYRHLQELPSGLSVMLAPSSASRAATVVTEAARRLAPMVGQLDDVVAFADCGRTITSSPWCDAADLVVVLVRQGPAAGSTVPTIDRTTELRQPLPSSSHIGLVIVGERPYPPAEIAAAVRLPLFGALPIDAPGAALAAGAWTVGRGASRTPLARAAGVVSGTIVEHLDARRATAMPVASTNGVDA